MVNVSRLVQTWAPAISRAATGYLIGERLVLTAWHATGDQTHPGSDGLQVRVFDPHGHTKWMQARRIWPTESPDIVTRPDLDVALVRIDDPDWVPRVGLEPVRFGRITGTRSITCRAVGFPRAEARPDDLRGTKDIAGRSEPLTALGQGLIVFTVTTSTPTAPDGWAGGSGAALHCGNLIIGVLVEDRRADYPGTQLRAADLAHLAEHTDLTQALSAHGITLAFDDATAPNVPAPPPGESAMVIDGPRLRMARRRKAIVTTVALIGALILALVLPNLFRDHDIHGRADSSSPPPGATTTGPRSSTPTEDTSAKTIVRPSDLPDPCQAASTLTVSEFGVSAGKAPQQTGGAASTTKSCDWATENNGVQRSYRLIGLSYVIGKGPLPAGFTPAPVSLPRVKAVERSDGLVCQMAWTTSFGAIVVTVGANTHAPAGATPDLCTVAAGWTRAIFANLPG